MEEVPFVWGPDRGGEVCLEDTCGFSGFRRCSSGRRTGTQLVTLVRPGHVGHFLEEVLVCERSVAWKGRSVVFCER